MNLLNRYKRFFKIDEINARFGDLMRERFDSIRSEFLESKHLLKTHNWDQSTGYEGSINSISYNGWQVMPMYMSFSDVNLVKKEEFLSSFKYQSDMSYSTKPNSELVIFENAEILKTLSKTCVEGGVIKRVGVSVFHPDSYINWHIDPDPVSDTHTIIRGVWGLDVPEEGESYILLGDESQYESWRITNNDCRLICGRTNHRLKNSHSSPLYTLIFDQEVPRSYLDNIVK
jgi:hypothetical protein